MNRHYGYSWTLDPSMVLDSGSGRVNETGPYIKTSSGPNANQGAVYVVAGSSGWATFQVGHHPAMFKDELETGSLVLDVAGNRLDAIFLRDTGAIDDSFTIIKGAPADPLRLATFSMKNGVTIATWNSEPGKTYRVETSDTVEGHAWEPASGNILASGAVTSWTNSVPSGATKKFYRVAKASE